MRDKLQRESIFFAFKYLRDTLVMINEQKELKLYLKGFLLFSIGSLYSVRIDNKDEGDDSTGVFGRIFKGESI